MIIIIIIIITLAVSKYTICFVVVQTAAVDQLTVFYKIKADFSQARD